MVAGCGHLLGLDHGGLRVHEVHVGHPLARAVEQQRCLARRRHPSEGGLKGRDGHAPHLVGVVDSGNLAGRWRGMGWQIAEGGAGG